MCNIEKKHSPSLGSSPSPFLHHHAGADARNNPPWSAHVRVVIQVQTQEEKKPLGIRAPLDRPTESNSSHPFAHQQ
jgi:hypothetical protein